MKKIIKYILVALPAFLVVVGISNAFTGGNWIPTSSLGTPPSITLLDIYNKLTDGSATSSSPITAATSTFDTLPTLDEIFAAIPSYENSEFTQANYNQDGFDGLNISEGLIDNTDLEIVRNKDGNVVIRHKDGEVLQTLSYSQLQMICAQTLPADKKMIFIGIDGFSIDAWQRYYVGAEGAESQLSLPNFERLIGDDGGWATTSIRGVATRQPATQAGNATLMTGLTNRVLDNTATNDPGTSMFEIIQAELCSLPMGVIYGKDTNYIIENLLSSVWDDNTVLKVATWTVGNPYTAYGVSQTNYGYAPNVVNLATSTFLSQYGHGSFFLDIYFGELDGLGHKGGWGSQGYKDGLLGVDEAIGNLLDYLEEHNIDANILIGADHGWNAADTDTSHSGNCGANPATNKACIFPLVSNNNNFLTTTDGSTGLGKINSSIDQCDIVPTIVDYYTGLACEWTVGDTTGNSNGANCKDHELIGRFSIYSGTDDFGNTAYNSTRCRTTLKHDDSQAYRNPVNKLY